MSTSSVWKARKNWLVKEKYDRKLSIQQITLCYMSLKQRHPILTITSGGFFKPLEERIRKVPNDESQTDGNESFPDWTAADCNRHALTGHTHLPWGCIIKMTEMKQQAVSKEPCFQPFFHSPRMQMELGVWAESWGTWHLSETGLFGKPSSSSGKLCWEGSGARLSCVWCWPWLSLAAWIGSSDSTLPVPSIVRVISLDRELPKNWNLPPFMWLLSIKDVLSSFIGMGRNILPNLGG